MKRDKRQEVHHRVQAISSSHRILRSCHPVVPLGRSPDHDRNIGNLLQTQPTVGTQRAQWQTSRFSESSSVTKRRKRISLHWISLLPWVDICVLSFSSDLVVAADQILKIELWRSTPRVDGTTYCITIPVLYLNATEARFASRC